jgi:hypothetical protein
MFMKKLVALFFRVIFVYANLSSVAMATQANRLAGQAMHCAGLFTVFAQAHAVEPVHGPRLLKARDIFLDVYLKEIDIKNIESVRDGVSARTSEVISALRSDWAARGSSLREQGVICGAWAEGFLGQGPHYQYVPVYPKVVPASVRILYQGIFDRVSLP